MVDSTDNNVNNFWSQRTPKEKLLLMAYYEQNIKPSEEPDILSSIFENYLPFQQSLIHYLSVSDLSRLSLTSKSFNALIPILDIAINRKSFSLLVHRLIQISGLHVKPRAVFDEKCRYVVMTGKYNEVCSICKITGVILTHDHMCRGTIYDKHPEQYFDELFNLKYHKKLTKQQKDYIKETLTPLFKQATTNLSKMPKKDKKRQFIELWDESEKRRNKFVKKS